MAFVIYPNVNSLYDALTADWGIAGSYGLLFETFMAGAPFGTAMGAEFDGTPDLYDVLVTGGIPVWPAAAAPANNISMAQVIRAIYDLVSTEVADILTDTGAIAWGDITTIDDEIAVIDGIVDNIIIATNRLDGAETAAVFSYLDAGAEQVVFTIATTARMKLHAILDRKSVV